MADEGRKGKDRGAEIGMFDGDTKGQRMQKGKERGLEGEWMKKAGMGVVEGDRKRKG
jgi:hypothetical protein